MFFKPRKPPSTYHASHTFLHEVTINHHVLRALPPKTPTKTALYH